MILRRECFVFEFGPLIERNAHTHLMEVLLVHVVAVSGLWLQICWFTVVVFVVLQGLLQPQAAHMVIHVL